MEKILSEPLGATNVPEKPMGKLMYDALKTHDEASPALVDLKSGEVYTYGQLVKYSINLASSLSKFVGQNDVMAIVSESSHKFCVAFLAGLYMATPMHFMNPDYTTYELKKLLLLSKPKLVVCSSRSLANVLAVKGELGFIETVVVLDQDIESNGVLLYQDLIQVQGAFEIKGEFDLKQHVAVICNSSGTTGLPKGVMITHETYRMDLIYAANPDIYNMEKNERVLLVIPFFHIYGLGIMKGSLYLGSKIFIMDQFNPKVYLETIQNHKVKKLFVVPSLTNFLARSPMVDAFDVSSVEEMFSAAAPPCEEIFKAVTTKFGLKTIRQIYGLTESSAGICLVPKDEKNYGSCGKLLPGRKLKIIDENGRCLGVKESGEICVANFIMKGYVSNDDVTKQTIDSDGFLHTGDVGYYDEEGYIYIIDRLKDLIKYKGFQVAPVELEDVLLQHPGVKDVGVVGKPDERFGELPVAFVVKADGTDVDEGELVRHVAEHVCLQKQLHGGVKFVSAIPKNHVGKILRKQLRDML